MGTNGHILVYWLLIYYSIISVEFLFGLIYLGAIMLENKYATEYGFYAMFLLIFCGFIYMK